MNTLLNRERASQLMERDQLDGLLVQLPVNTYYLSNYWGVRNTPGSHSGHYFVVLPRDPEAPAALVVPESELAPLATAHSNGGGTWIPEIFAYGTADAAGAGNDAGGPMAVAVGTALTEQQQNWLRSTQLPAEQLAPEPLQALLRALRVAGLAGAVLGVDDARTISWLSTADTGSLTLRYKPHLCAEIRLIKTASEIELLRTAAHVNEMALLLAADAMLAGSAAAELENMFMLCAAQQGGRGVSLRCGAAGLPAGVVQSGEPVGLESVGTYAHYYGVSARSAVVGESSALMRKRHAHLLLGWEAAREKLQPGCSYAEVAAAAGAAVRRAGIAGCCDPAVHSVGLEYQDDPQPVAALPAANTAQFLQPNMVVSVVLAYAELGWGSISLQETVLITTYGHERFSTTGMSIRTSGVS